MRERLERSVAALLVARHGRADCAEVATLLEPWDGTFSVLWRKRVARHVDGCATCDRRRRAVPAMLFSGIEYDVSDTQGFGALAGRDASAACRSPHPRDATDAGRKHAARRVEARRVPARAKQRRLNPPTRARLPRVSVGSLRWWFENRETGRITVAQFPNWPLFAIAFGWVVLFFADDGSLVHDAVRVAVTGLWLFWGADEVIRGVNPFRRVLGALVIAWQLTGVFT